MADPFGSSRESCLEAFSFKQLLFEPLLGGGLPRFNAVALLLTLASLLLGLHLGRQTRRR